MRLWELRYLSFLLPFSQWDVKQGHWLWVGLGKMLEVSRERRKIKHSFREQGKWVNRLGLSVYSANGIIGCLLGSTKVLTWVQAENNHYSTFNFLCCRLQLKSTGTSTQRLKFKHGCTGWCGSVDWTWAWEAKGHWFDSQSGNVPGLQARSPVGGAGKATTDWCFSLSLFSSLLPFPSLPLIKINKILQINKLIN